MTAIDERKPKSEPARPLVALANVDVVREGRPVLRDISWRLVEGEHWGVVGPNGAGKTSFLGLISGSLWPAPGRGERRYDFGDGPLRDAVQARRRIAFVGPELQDRYARWSWNFSAVDVVRSGVQRTDVPRRAGSAADGARARAIMRKLDIERLGERRFLELSRGEQRRVLIARSLAFRPAVLLLDEPMSGLDRAARDALDAMLEAVGEHAALLCSGHAAPALPSVVDHVLELERGRIVHAGPLRRGAARGVPRRDSVGAATVHARPREAAAPEAPDLIDVTRADVWLGSRRVLHDIDWRLRNGEHWLVTGANGAGKSTFLRLLHGQLRPARGGSIRWPGLGDPRSVWALRRAVAWVSPELQAAYRYPSTALSCIASGFDSSVGLTREPTPGEMLAVRRLLEVFALESLAERALPTLSYGQVRRALIARALVNAPRILLLDEPWEGLDDPAAALLDSQLGAIAARGTALVVASHLRRDGARFTHELALDRGLVAAAGARSSPR